VPVNAVLRVVTAFSHGSLDAYAGAARSRPVTGISTENNRLRVQR
jgi:hypothetical protein